MYLKNWEGISRCDLQGIAFFIMVTMVAGCSSGTQRFAGGFYNSEASSRSDMITNTAADRRVLLQGDGIQSSELPPIDSRGDTGNNYNSSRSGEVFLSDGRVMGAPPRNLGTLPRSEADDLNAFRRNSYIVQSGDTLLSIAQQVGVSINALKLANGMRNDAVYIGQKLIIPERRVVTTSNTQNSAQSVSTTAPLNQPKATSTAESKKNLSYVREDPLKTAPSVKAGESNIGQHSFVHTVPKTTADSSNAATDPDSAVAPQSTGISKMRWPARGRLLSHYGQKKGMTTSRGIDIAVPEGSSVKAAENGVVIYASDGLKELGNVVMIRHENNIVTIYGHNSKLVVNRGQSVRRGDEIAKSGVSGDVTTPRVYFEVRKDSVPVNPAEYLEN
ncbi:putative virulence determinant [Bartonella australis AUST/NH1]|uniref:Putative virulence determinant n=1 Tax=Bartonella australis (strain Aust/NH1) TaxID=1094489 RepID=M1PCM9_BARAA|nr:M23 family metallopeptidase [Bartonella australis]AGF74366.1 putative virulence determinant [Bartonella australis AUST/NH1]